MATKVGDLFAELNLKAKKALEDIDKFIGGLNTATDDAEGTEKAYRAGADLLGADAASAMPGIEDWCDTLDKALPALDQLRPADKGKLVNALIATTMADNKVAVEEMELLRVICLVIHVPLPMISGSEAG